MLGWLAAPVQWLKSSRRASIKEVRLNPDPEWYVRFERAERREEVTPGLGWEWGKIGWAQQDHKGMDWFSVWGIFHVFICSLLRELLHLEPLCYIYCIARSQQRHKSGDSNAEDGLIGWHTLGAFCSQREVPSLEQKLRPTQGLLLARS